MPSKIASETPFRLSSAFWTLLITFAAGVITCLVMQANGNLVCPAGPVDPVPAPTVLPLEGAR